MTVGGVLTPAPVDLTERHALIEGEVYQLQNLGPATAHLSEQPSGAAPDVATTPAHRVPSGAALLLEPAAGKGVWAWTAGGDPFTEYALTEAT